MVKKVIAYTHFHWDREWYKEHEKFRFRLIKCFDIVLDLLQQNKIPSFYFDGQTSALLDYLEIYPQKKVLIKSLVKDKRLFIGPFYCLVDEFLTSRPAFTKNLEIGLETAHEFGCNDFIAYFADTFGHSACTIPILNKFGIDKAIVWRGCGDIPAEFTWQYRHCEEHSDEAIQKQLNHLVTWSPSHCSSMKTVNLIRGYFQDVFSTNWDINKKTEFLKSNLDKIAEKSGNTLLLPIGADHLATPLDLDKQIKLVNEQLEDYEIALGSPFDYFNEANDRFTQHVHTGELRDNSKTFILEGCYSSRLDIKKWNIVATQKLETAEALIRHCEEHCEESPYKNILNHAYKLLLQNQAHDSICGCSTDDVHAENITRYKKIIQIADSIIEDYKIEYKKEHSIKDIKIINLDNYQGEIIFESEKELPYQIIGSKKGFPTDIFYDINKIPITEDYTDIYTYKILNQVQNNNESDVFVSDNALGNSKIMLQVKNNALFIGEHEIKLVDFIDLGDSYNCGLKTDDNGLFANLISSNIAFEHPTSCGLKLEYELNANYFNEKIFILATLNSQDNKIKFNINWDNTHKNHYLQFSIDTQNPISKTQSEDLNEIIERNFNPDYNPREHLPQSKGIEVMLNNAPMQRGVSANNITVVTQGITQYEVAKTELRLPLLRATGVISNPQNPSRTTPAGPPIETPALQQIGQNSQTLWIALSSDLKTAINEVYHKYIVI